MADKDTLFVEIYNRWANRYGPSTTLRSTAFNKMCADADDYAVSDAEFERRWTNIKDPRPYKLMPWE